MKKITKNRYIQGFCLTVVILGVVRAIWPGIAQTSSTEDAVDSVSVETAVEPETHEADTIPQVTSVRRDFLGEESLVGYDLSMNAALDAQVPFRKHRIFSVPSYDVAFPDSNHVHFEQALRWGVNPIASKEHLSLCKDRLVYINDNMYYSVDSLTSSVPYLVPRAALLLQDIGRNFYDSLMVKGIPLHQIIVSSVFRSTEDVSSLSTVNKNVSKNSCHRYATTFDISYVRYKTVEAPGGPHRREVRNDSLKFVLSEVLNDLKKNDRCLVKYERKQPCFHITVK